MDIFTSLVFVEVLTTVNCIAAFLLWKAYGHLHGLAEVSVGCLSLTLAFLFMAFRTPHMITASNVALIFAVAMATEGIAVFIGKPSMRWLVYALTAFTAVLWEILLFIVPAQITLRVVVMTVMLVAMYVRLAWVALHNGRKFGIARLCLLVCLFLHIAVLLARMTVSLVSTDQNFIFSQAFQPWFLLESAVVMTLFFFSVMIMVGSRLREDLDQGIESLAVERRMHGQLKQFLSMLGHELRTPLAIIERSAEMSEVLLDPPQHEVGRRLGIIRSTVGRIRELMDNLLMAERAELDSAYGELVDLTKIVRDLTKLLAHKYETERIIVDLPETRVAVRGDGEMLATAIGNLLDNALKFSPDDQPVQVCLQTSEVIRITISDNGIGFPIQQMQQIGRRFFRGANAADIPGTGLGLNIAKTIVERHRGQVDLANRQEGGAMAMITLQSMPS